MNQLTASVNTFAQGSDTVSLLIVLVATLVLSFVSRVIVNGLGKRAAATKTQWDDALTNSIRLPMFTLIWVIGVGLAANIVLAGSQDNVIKTINALRDLLVIIVITWFVLRFINHAQGNFRQSLMENNKPVDHSAMDAIGKLLRLAVVIVGSLIAMQTLGFSISGVLTFGGIGGIAIGFAAKDLLSNFFGGLIIYLDRPFAVGDWIRSPDREIEGTVEEIGWRVTRVRNFDSRPLYIPNSVFSSIALENPSRMTNRKIYETIGIRYDDANAIEAIVQETTEFLKSHPGIDQDKSVMANFTAFAPSSLDFFVYCFTKTSSGAEFNLIKQGILLKVLEIIKHNNAEIAYPTTTTILKDQVNNPD